MAKKTSDFFDDKIALRNNWLKIFVVVVFTGIISVKLWQADFSQVFSGFDFSDLLTLFLALFSIALAVLFYLKATETSNVFYDNTYRFTKDVSEILGRLESGFGERLKHLDEGYSGLKSAVEKLPFDRKKAQKEIEEEEKQLEKVESKRNELIEELAKRANLEKDEKSKLLERFKKQDRELSDVRKELSFLRERMKRENNPIDDIRFNIPPSILRLLDNEVIPMLDQNILFNSPKGTLRKSFSNIMDKLGAVEVRMLKNYGIVDRYGDLTIFGREFLRGLLFPAKNS